MSVHAMGAMILSTPELELDESEAKKLSDAIQNVSQYYPVGLSPKTLAWVNLAMCAGGIYGTRFVAARARLKKEADKKKADKVIPLTPVQSPAKPNGAAAPGPLTPSQVFGAFSGVSED